MPTSIVDNASSAIWSSYLSAARPSSISQYDVTENVFYFLRELEPDPTLVPSLGRKFFVNAVPEIKRAILRSVLTCIFSGPVGVDKIPLSQCEYKPSNRILANFCKTTSKGLSDKKSTLFNLPKQNSPLQNKYGCIWLECSDQITNSILELKENLRSQKEIYDKLKVIVTGI